MATPETPHCPGIAASDIPQAVSQPSRDGSAAGWPTLIPHGRAASSASCLGASGASTHLHVLHELVVAVDVHRLELAHLVELELDLDGLAVAGLVLPADPAEACDKQRRIRLGKAHTASIFRESPRTPGMRTRSSGSWNGQKGRNALTITPRSPRDPLGDAPRALIEAAPPRPPHF